MTSTTKSVYKRGSHGTQAKIRIFKGSGASVASKLYLMDPGTAHFISGRSENLFC